MELGPEILLGAVSRAAALLSRQTASWMIWGENRCRLHVIELMLECLTPSSILIEPLDVVPLAKPLHRPFGECRLLLPVPVIVDQIGNLIDGVTIAALARTAGTLEAYAALKDRDARAIAALERGESLADIDGVPDITRI